jgi:cell division septum initiation protein DivIVA
MAEAAALLSAANSDADQVTSSAVAEADQLLAAARDEAQQVADQAQQARTEQAADLERTRVAALADLADEKAHLAAAVDRLREVERDHVSRMRTYLTEELQHLDELDRGTDVAAVSDTAA